MCLMEYSTLQLSRAVERDAGERSASLNATVAVARETPSKACSSLPTLRAAAECETPM